MTSRKRVQYIESEGKVNSQRGASRSMFIEIALRSFGPDVALEAFLAELVRRLFIAQMLLMPFDDFLPLELPLEDAESGFDRLTFTNENLNQINHLSFFESGKTRIKGTRSFGQSQGKQVL